MVRIKLQGEIHVRACVDGERECVCVCGVERTRCQMMGFVQVLYVESIDRNVSATKLDDQCHVLIGSLMSLYLSPPLPFQYLSSPLTYSLSKM